MRQVKVTREDLSKIVFKVKADPSRERVEKVIEIPLKPEVMLEIEEVNSTSGQTQVELNTKFVDLEQIYIV